MKLVPLKRGDCLNSGDYVWIKVAIRADYYIGGADSVIHVKPYDASSFNMYAKNAFKIEDENAAKLFKTADDYKDAFDLGRKMITGKK